MRALPIAILAAAAAGSAAAQVLPPPPVAAAPYFDPARANLEFQLQDQQRRAIDLDAQMMALEARLRAEQGIAVSRAQAARPYLPEPYIPGVLPPSAGQTDAAPVDASKLVSIPDDRLAASNAAVRAVTESQRR